MLSREARLQGYAQAGNDFLADRIEGLFRHISNEQDKALHNVILEEVILMIGSEEETKKQFFQTIAHRILEKRTKEKARWSFVKIVAERLNKLRKG